MTPMYTYPDPLETVLTLQHDTAGWTIQSVLDTAHDPPAQVFTIPAGTPDGNGVTLTIPGSSHSQQYHGVLYLTLPTGAGIVIDVFPPVVSNVTLPRLVLSGQFLGQE